MSRQDSTRRSTHDEQNMNDDSHVEMCPICLGGEEEEEDHVLVRGPCQHACCLPCLERVLSAPDPRRNSREWSTFVPAEDAHLHVPTRGRCPICRSELCLFDLQTVNETLAISKNHDITTTSLKGRVFVQNRQTIGSQSIHFPAEPGQLPYVDFSKDNSRATSNDLGHQQAQLPDQKYFEPDCHFHEQTRSFHGRLKWGEEEDCQGRVGGSHRWECILAFSSDYRFIARGIWVKQRRICQDSKCSRLACKFPFDGRWKVSWPNMDKPAATYQVHGNYFCDQSALPLDQDGDHLDRLDLSDPQILGLHMKESNRVEHVATRDVRQHPIQVGESIEFAGNSNSSNMIWRRETVTPEEVPLKVVQLGPDHPSRMYYHELLTSRGPDQGPPAYHANAVWGNTFGQGLTVGFASYHFVEDGSGAYISYEHEQTAMWPPLDNGSPVPARMWFTEFSFDAENRVFRGKIDWQGTHSTTWQGCRWWRYEIRFATNFTCITGGYVNSVPRGSNEEMDMSKFGVELVYVNVGLLEKLRDESGNNRIVHNRHLVELSNAIGDTLDEDGSEEDAIAMLRLRQVFLRAELTRIRYPSSFGIQRA